MNRNANSNTHHVPKISYTYIQSFNSFLVISISVEAEFSTSSILFVIKVVKEAKQLVPGHSQQVLDGMVGF